MSARDVLIEAMAHRQFAFGGTYTRWERVDQDVRDGYLHLAGEALDALLAHPVELLALLAEPKVCPRCNGTTEHGPLYRGDICLVCGGTGSVAVDVLDLLVQAGLVEEVGHMKPHPLEILPTRPVFAAKDGTP